MPHYVKQVETIFTLCRLGTLLCYRTSDLLQDELPEDMRQLLVKLGQVESQERAEQHWRR